uniref:Uncharacterized protein n=1 Tax=Cannabis sativa TaxID=3483 RepID=A0A803Q9J1_CANSA
MITIKTPADQLEPRDTYKIAYIMHFLLGAGNLLPWNAFITGVDYFGFLYPYKHVEKVFSVAYMSCSMLVLVLMLIWGSCYGKLSSRLTLNLGFSMFVLSLMVAPMIDWVWCTESSEKTYGVTVASVAVCGIADGLVGGSLMGSAGRLPKQYMQAVFAGTASSVMQKLSKIEEQTEATFCLRPQIFSVARKVRWPAFGIFIIYIVTLSIFPGFIAENLESKILQDCFSPWTNMVEN